MSVTTNVNISGMHCNHCIASVTEELQELEGVEGVAIDLNKDSISRAVITSRAEPTHGKSKRPSLKPATLSSPTGSERGYGNSSYRHPGH